MMNKENTKIFIDTNIFLNLYNSNDSGSVDAFMKVLFKYKRILITTEQAFNEYLRSRSRIIGQFKASFLASRTKEQTSSFMRSLTGFDEYNMTLKKLHDQHKAILNEIEDVMSDPTKDFIYNGFIKLWKNNKIPTTDSLIDASVKRKATGDPPGGDKFSNGDELIWAALLQEAKSNLIVVSKDLTYTQNEEYLKYEYHRKTQYELAIVDTVKDALDKLNIKMDKKAAGAEDSIRWLELIIQALKQLGGRGKLLEIYEECRDLVTLFYPDKEEKNQTIESTIRRTIYQHSSDVSSYLGKEDLFHQVEMGVWELRNRV